VRHKIPAVLIALIVAAVLIGALLAFYAGFAYAASYEIRRSGLPPHVHNAMKHAYASAEVYSAVRPIVGADRAAAFVIFMGESNERAERYLKHQPDWSRESYKDMRNNLAGIEAAEWLYQRRGWTLPFTRLALIGRMAAADILIPEDIDPRLDRIENVFSAEVAIAMMRNDTAQARQDIRAQLDAEEASLLAP
jgi:hypothetical protein